MDKVKTVLAIIGGVAVLILGYLLASGSLFHRRGISGVGQHLDDAGQHSDNAGAAIAEAGDINLQLQSGNTASQRLLARGREIMAKAKARSDSNGG